MLPCKTVAHAASNLNVGADGGDLLRLLLQPKGDSVLARLSIDVLRGEAAADRARASLVRIAVNGVLRNGTVIPVAGEFVRIREIARCSCRLSRSHPQL